MRDASGDAAGALCGKQHKSNKGSQPNQIAPMCVAALKALIAPSTIQVRPWLRVLRATPCLSCIGEISHEPT
jgi:hypothetical protein